ncbi:MAG TPA: WcbI family polysaccharide biosynthesis putative acetyltransferase [Lapillicoccus sp.]|nr:WcbI family polysaccharide biosynthesis putative acetyltransferase [Lapillicoccus sp.]
MRPTNPDLPPVALADLPRAMHYGEFYGLKPMPASDKPLLVVHGNCQAESIRLLLQGAEDAPCVSVRVPAVHELTADEIPFLKRLLERAAVVLTQPVSDGYHDLPLGASEVHAAAPAARLVRWPVIRYAGLLPWHIVFSHEDVGDPPVVPYHDVRTIALALGEDVPRTDPAGIRAVAHWSITELHDRETRAGAVPVSRLVLDAGADASNTINHPGNPVLVPLARAIERRLGWPVTAADPGYELLDSVRAPRDPRVLNALGLDVDDGLDVSGENWVVDGKPVPNSEVVEIQLAWYHQHPEVLAAVAARSAEQRRLLGSTAA